MIYDYAQEQAKNVLSGEGLATPTDIHKVTDLIIDWVEETRALIKARTCCCVHSY